MKIRHKNKFKCNLTRKLKHIPYGSVRTKSNETFVRKFNGGEMFSGGIINKALARRKAKDIIKLELNEI